jgi:hypothetical protein
VLGFTTELAGILQAVTDIFAISPQTHNSRFQEIPSYQLAGTGFSSYPAISLFQVANEVEDFGPTTRLQLRQLFKNLLLSHTFYRHLSLPILVIDRPTTDTMSFPQL